MGNASHKHYMNDGSEDPHIQIDLAPFFVIPIFINMFMPEDKQIKIMTGIPPFNPFKTSTMLSMVAIWMAFNLIGIVMMIFMIDLPGNGLMGKGTINSIQSAVLRWMTMGAVATNLRVNHSHYEPDGQGGWQLKKSAPMNGGNKGNKTFKALLYLYLFALLGMCFIVGLVFPKDIKEMFTGQLGVPMSNMANLPGGMNSNMTQFTDFIHSRHNPEINTQTMSSDHKDFLQDVNYRNETINNGINLFDEWKEKKGLFGKSSKKPRQFLYSVDEEVDSEFNNQYYVPDSQRKATEYTCVNDKKRDTNVVIPSAICP